MAQRRSTTPPQIIDEASQWFITMRELSVSAEDRAAFADWLRASPVHVGTYMEVARLWADAARISPDVATNLDDVPPPNVVAIREGRDSARHPKPAATGVEGAPPRGGGRRMRWFAVAASLVLLSGASLFAWRLFGADTYSTDIGEQRVLTLADHSIVRLNSRSKLTVRMTRERREFELREGQALFEVAHDSAKPFIVKSGNIQVRAVGTQFDVNRKRSGTVVTVVEGRVKVDAVPLSALSQLFSSPPKNAHGALRVDRAPSGQVSASSGRAGSVETDLEEVFVSAGEQLRVSRDGALPQAEKTDAAAAISWLQQELRFDGQPLSDVLEEFNRYSHVPIVLNDAALGDLRVNAVFHTTNPDSLLHYVAGLQGVQVERADTEIRISRRP
jgi:transmembrane sensor